MLCYILKFNSFLLINIYNTLTFVSMKSSLTVFFQNTSTIEQVLEAFEKFVSLSNLQAMRKENKEVQKWVCEVEIHSLSQKDLIVSKLTEIESQYSTKIEYKVTLIKETGEEKSEKCQKITSQEVKKENKKYQVAENKNNELNSNQQGTPMQSCQTISVSSDEFQVLDYEIEDVVISQENEENVEFVKGQFKNENQEKDINQAKGLQEQKDNEDIPQGNTEEKFQGKQQSASENTENKEEQDVNFDQSKDERIQIQETNQLLFKYYAGKDDYTTVFKVSSNDQITNQEPDKPQKNQSIESPQENPLDQKKQQKVHNQNDEKINENQPSQSIAVQNKNVPTAEEQITYEEEKQLLVKDCKKVQNEYKTEEIDLTQFEIKVQVDAEQSAKVGQTTDHQVKQKLIQQGQVGDTIPLKVESGQKSQEKLSEKDIQTITNDQSQPESVQLESMIFSRLSECNSTTTANELNKTYDQMINYLAKAQTEKSKYSKGNIIMGAALVFGFVFLASNYLMD